MSLFARVAILPLLCGLAAPSPGQTLERAGRLNQEGAERLRAGNPAEALEKFLAAARLAPDDPALQFNIGLTLFQLGRWDEALAPIEKSIAHPPSAAQARYLRGAIHFQRNDFAACAGDLELVRGDPRFAEQALFMLVESYRRSGNAAASQAAFLELERRYPDSAFLHKLMGMAYDQQEMPAKALEEFEAALRVRPDMPDVAFGIGYIHFKQASLAEARRWFLQELRVQPCFARAHYYLAEIDRAAEAWDKAASSYTRALECDPDLGDALLGLGDVAERQNDLPEAIRRYQAAVKRMPEDSKARFKLANSLRRAGRQDEASVELARAKDLYRKEQAQQAGERKKRRERER